MNRLDHRIFGACAGLGYAALAGLPDWQTVACAAVGTVTAGGPWSPDCDQCRPFTGDFRLKGEARRDSRAIGVRFLEAALLAIGPNTHGDPTDHRRITHWWGLPATVAPFLAVASLSLPVDGSAPSGGPLAALGVAAALVVHLLWSLWSGWVSHLAGDWAFGKRSRNRGPGIPVAPWWGHVGLGLKSDGWLAHAAVWLIIVPAGASTLLRFDYVASVCGLA